MVTSTKARAIARRWRRSSGQKRAKSRRRVAGGLSGMCGVMGARRAGARTAAADAGRHSNALLVTRVRLRLRLGLRAGARAAAVALHGGTRAAETRNSTVTTTVRHETLLWVVDFGRRLGQGRRTDLTD